CAASLILAVFNHPELYNVTLPNYRCTESRINAWRSISTVLGLPSEECKRKWKNMRDRYLKEVRMEIKSKKQGEIVQSRWKYRQLMNFIAPFTGSRSGEADICGSNDDDHDNPDNESGSAEAETTLSEAVKTKQSPPSAKLDGNGWLVKDNGTPFPNRPRDEDELFLLSFVPALKRLAPQKRCETKIKIQQVMYEAEFNVAQPGSQEKQPEPEPATQD
uniref:Transcription factor Adf-1 n=1 Tax=Sander lucioperca TaxID=283035 RepID=A0A8C9YVT5_SANLU